MKISHLIFQLVLPVVVLEGANILVVLPIPWYSHTNTFMPIFKELASRGHNITMVSPFPQSEPTPNWTDLIVNETIFVDIMRVGGNFLDQSVYWFYPNFWNYFLTLMDIAFQDKTLQNLIKAENLKYDLLVVEPFYSEEPLIALGHKLNVPVVALHALSLTPWQAYLTGNELSFHLLPNIRTTHTDKMSFLERIDNVLVNFIEFSLAYFSYIPKKQKQMDRYMVYHGSENRPSLLTMLRNVSLTLIDYHPSILYPEPLQPNTIPVGGLSLTHAKELPKDLKEIMDNASSGVIFLSFGSILKGGELPDRILKSLLEAFGQLDQTVLMKWEFDNVSNKPNNVIIRKWLPQPSILAHKNVKIFITHAGLHGITEGAYFGVPLLCIPLFSDQQFDARYVEETGFGITLRPTTLTTNSLLSSINLLLNNKRYKAVAEERSAILKDRPLTALQSAVFWIEYVLRHKGAGHLKPARTELSLYEIIGIDIILFITFIAIIIIFGVFQFVSLMYSFIFQKVAKNKKD